jgi:hypothetical protein
MVLRLRAAQAPDRGLAGTVPVAPQADGWLFFRILS